jgi:hypothetical protein
MTPKPTARPLAPLLGAVMIGVGALTLALGAAGHGFAARGLPPVLTYANLAAGALELLIGYLVTKRSAAGWAFGVTIAFVMLFYDLLGAPQLVRAGPSGWLGLGLAVLRSVNGIVLATRQDEFRSAPRA